MSYIFLSVKLNLIHSVKKTYHGLLIQEKKYISSSVSVISAGVETP